MGVVGDLGGTDKESYLIQIAVASQSKNGHCHRKIVKRENWDKETKMPLPGD